VVNVYQITFVVIRLFDYDLILLDISQHDILNLCKIKCIVNDMDFNLLKSVCIYPSTETHHESVILFL